MSDKYKLSLIYFIVLAAPSVLGAAQAVEIVNKGANPLKIAVNGFLSSPYTIEPNKGVFLTRHKGERVPEKWELIPDGEYSMAQIAQPATMEWERIPIPFDEIKKLDILDPKAKLGRLTGYRTIAMDIKRDLLEVLGSEKAVNEYNDKVIYYITPGLIEGFTLKMVRPTR